MNKIDQLLKKYCPNGVEEYSLPEVATINNGVRITKKELLENGEFDVYNGSINVFGKYSKWNTKKYASLIVKYGSAGLVTFLEKNSWVGDPSYVIETKDLYKLTPKYLYYFLKSKENYFIKNKGLGTPPNLPRLVVETFKISVPPIEIQNKIVEILDNFSELEAELEFRNIQYEHYNNKLLDFDNNQSLLRKLTNGNFLNKEVKSYKLKDISKINIGQQLNKELFNNGEYFVYNGGVTPSGKYDKWNVEENHIAISQGGESAGDVKFIKEKFWAGAHCYYIFSNNEEKYNQKYLYYFLKNEQTNLANKANGVAIKGLSKSILEDFEIKVPSIEIQNRIVRVLEKLETYNKDVNTGLPAELNARKSQYDYYLNKLLTFKTGGAIGSEQLECFKFLENILNFTIEYKELWSIVNFDKKFKGVDKNKQKTILKFKHISATNLKKYFLVPNCNEVRLLSTGLYDEYTKYNKNDLNINYGEVISIPSGGDAILKYHHGYFIDSLNILFSSKDPKQWNLKFIYYFLKSKTNFIRNNFVGSSIKHPNMKEIINLIIPIPSLDIQNKIVQVLDKLELYSKNINAGLPQEIKLRKNQFDFYLNKLLKFNK